MAMLKPSDIIEAVTSSVKDKYSDMANTKFIADTTVTTAKLAQERIQAIRQAFNNHSATSTANNAHLFRNILKGVDSRKHDLEGAEDEFISSGTREENENTPAPARPQLSADTISRNQTAYDVAGIQIKAVVAQTQAIVTTLSDQTTYLKNIDTNLQKLMTAVTAGFSSLNQQNEDAAKDMEMYNKKGYINLQAYFKQLNDQTATALQPFKNVLSAFKDPKTMSKMIAQTILDTKAFDNLFQNVEDIVSKTATSMIDRLADSKFLKNTKNPLVNALRSILIPNSNTGDLETVLSGAAGVTDIKRAQFDNVTHRTINDVIPGLLERILAQNEMVTSILQSSTGITGKSSGTTYDMRSGKFSTFSKIRNSITNQFDEFFKGNQFSFSGSTKVSNDIDLSSFADIIGPMVYAMAALGEPIQNIQAKDPNLLINMLKWGKPDFNSNTDIPHFILFYNALKPGPGKDDGAQRRATQQITTYYNNIKRQIDQQHKEIAAQVGNGTLRNDQIGYLSGMDALELRTGKFNNYDDRITLANAPKRGKALGSQSFHEIGKDAMGGITSAVEQFGTEIRDLGKDLKDMLSKPGSVYVHDTVLIEYVKALRNKFAPRHNASGIKNAVNIHRNAHPGVTDPTMTDNFTVKAGTRSTYTPSGNTSAEESPESLSGQTFGIPTIDDFLNKNLPGLKIKGMQLAQQAGYSGFDKQLQAAGVKQNGVSWIEQSKYKTDIKTLGIEIDNALASGVINPDQASQLRKDLALSSPEEYKKSMLKTMSQWSPVVLGGLVAGPFGALAGLGVRNLMRKTNADRIENQISKLRKNALGDNKANAKAEQDKEAIREQIRQLNIEGKLTDEEMQEALMEINSATADEYKGGLMKWAKRLGPIAIAALTGIGGPLGLLVGAFIGKRLSETTAQKMRRQFRKVKPRNDVWDNSKRKELINQINKKIEEIESTYEQLDEDQKVEADESIAKLREYRRDIMGAGAAKLAWYFTSLPGLLNLVWNIRKLPGMLFRGVGKGLSWVGDKAVGFAKRGVSFVGSAIDKWSMTHPSSGAAIQAVKKVLGGAASGLGAVAGLLTGRTQKRAAARANKAASEVEKILRGDPTSANVVATAEVAAQVAETNDTLSGMYGLMIGNSVSTSDSVTHALLKKILHAVAPDEDLSDVMQLENIHSKETGQKTVKVTPKKVSAKAGQIVNGQKVKDENTDDVTRSALVSSIGNTDSSAEANAKFDTIKKVLTNSAETPQVKQEINEGLDEVRRNLKDEEKNGSGGNGGAAEEKTFLDKILDSLKNGAQSWGLPGVANLALSILPVIPALKLGGDALKGSMKSFSEPINEKVQTRNQHISSVTNAEAAKITSSAALASRLSKSISNSIDVVNQAADFIPSGMKTSSMMADLSQNIGTNKMLARASRFMDRFKNSAVVSKIAQSDAYKTVKKLIDGFLDTLKSKIVDKISKLISKVVPKDKMDDLCLKAFAKGGKMLKTFARVLEGIGFFLDVLARLAEKVEQSDPEYHSKIAPMLPGDPAGNFAAIIGYLFSNAERIAETGGDNIFEMIAKSIAGSMLDNAISKAFPVWAIVKLVAALISLGLGQFLGDDGSKDKQFPYLRALQFFCDDILAFDQAVVQGIADTIFDLGEALMSLFTFNPSKISDAFMGLLDTVANTIYNAGTQIVLAIADFLLIFLTGITKILEHFLPSVSSTKLLECRKYLTAMLSGEISATEFCDALGIDTTYENNVWNFYAGDMDSALMNMQQAQLRAMNNTTITPTENKKTYDLSDTKNIHFAGRGRNSNRRYGGGNNDLYQESAMYKNAPFDMYNSGCGPIALTAALRSQGIQANPMSTAAVLSPYRVSDGGTTPDGILNIGNALGGRFSPGSTDTESILASARSGKPVVMMGQGSAFGSGMHYMTAVGASGDNLLVRDPLSPNLKRIPADHLGSVSSAIYGRGGGQPAGRGILTDGLSSLVNTSNNILSSVTNLFGGWFGGNESNSTEKKGRSSFYDGLFKGGLKKGSLNAGKYTTGQSGYVNKSPQQAFGKNTSVDGTITYPDEFRVDPGGKFPRTGYTPYSEILPAVKSLLIAQYKYTLILPSVIACIMRGETEFGKTAHEKNLGNIKKSGSRDGGTKQTTNRIYDKREGSNDDYEAYNYWGESIYRIGNFLSTIPRYAAAVGNKDTLNSLTAIAAAGYATAPGYAATLYNYWSEKDMQTLKSYDNIAMSSATAGSKTGAKAVAYGRGGLTDSLSSIVDVSNNILSSVTNLFGGWFGGNDSSGEDGSAAEGDDSTGENGGKPVKGSFLERVKAYLEKSGNPVKDQNNFGATGSPYSVSKPHTGVDLATAEGTPIYAPTDGTIIKRVNDVPGTEHGSTGNRSMGNYIQLQDSQGRIHWFEHLQHNSPTRASSVKAGDYIGKVGNTGNSYGAHLHYQINNPGTGYYQSTDPHTIAGYGRKQDSPPIGGGAAPEDYTKVLSDIYAVLQLIAENTGVSSSIMQGTQSSLNKYSSRNTNKSIRPQPIGIGYQKLTRGY